ncbi:MAG: hypothetical protein IJM37_10755 [Lachnospiraceae bacterium]|nr:hypothetical protein [Lachnospiraceae bacterium]
MDKNEILKRARKEGNDEMKAQIQDKAMKWSYAAMALSAAFFCFIRAMRDLPVSDLWAVACISACAAYTYKFIKGKEMSDLILGICMFVPAVIATVNFFRGY